VLVIGVGNDLRGDDGAGLELARRLAAQPRPGAVTVVAHRGDAVSMIEVWRDSRAVIIVDAMCSGACPGAILRLDASSVPIAWPRRPSSSHAIGPAETIELSRALGTLPARVIVYGIEGGGFEAGTALSAPVSRALDRLGYAVCAEALRLAGSRDGLSGPAPYERR
jgi:hydrogenase maturation protease